MAPLGFRELGMRGGWTQTALVRLSGKFQTWHCRLVRESISLTAGHLKRIPMIDHTPQQQLKVHSVQADDVLDALTLELKIELARIEQEESLAAERLEPCRDDAFAILNAIAALNKLNGYERVNRHGRAVGMLDALDVALATIGSTEVINRYRTSLVELIAGLREQRRKARSLMVRAMQAVFNIPLCLDGPELSGYRHRLR